MLVFLLVLLLFLLVLLMLLVLLLLFGAVGVVVVDVAVAVAIYVNAVDAIVMVVCIGYCGRGSTRYRTHVGGYRGVGAFCFMEQSWDRSFLWNFSKMGKLCTLAWSFPIAQILNI